MCLAIPGEILSIDESDPVVRNGRVSFGGVVKEVSLAMVPEAEVGQYVLIHAGVALNVIDEEEARETLACFEELGELQALDGADPEEML